MVLQRVHLALFRGRRRCTVYSVKRRSVGRIITHARSVQDVATKEVPPSVRTAHTAGENQASQHCCETCINPN